MSGSLLRQMLVVPLAAQHERMAKMRKMLKISPKKIGNKLGHRKFKFKSD